jgi:glutamyl-tRNA synthetase
VPPPNRPDITEPCRVRFAPSPTGSLHVGGARTALFNWLIARKTGGVFVLRLEDTDRERSTPESEAEILRVLRWLGLDWDEGPFRQSERDAIYRDAIDRMKASGHVYPAYETDAELEAQREAARTDKRAPVIRGKREYTPDELAGFAAEGRRPVWRFAVPVDGETAIEDMVRGTVAFGHANIEDFVVARSDGTPTYNLAAAVDDIEMRISHVIRGEDHISNTPKQMLVMRALDAEPPTYAHIPLILGPDKKRLSKRHGAASVEEFEADGFLPEPLVNSLALLGWSYDDKTERFTLPELIQAFSVARVSKSPAVFDVTRAEVFHGRYLRMMDPQAFEDALAGYLTNTGFIAEHGGAEAEAAVRRSAYAVKGKLTKLSEYPGMAGWLFGPLDMHPDAWDKIVGDVKHSIQVIGGGLGRLEGLTNWELKDIKDALQDQLHILGENARDFLEPQRIAITGQPVSIGVYDAIYLVGRDEAVARYRATMGRLAELWAA